MKKRFLLVLFAVFALLNSVSFAWATAAEAPAPDATLLYGGIIAILVATVAVIFYIVCTYLKRK